MSQNLQYKLSVPIVIIGGGIMGCATAYYLAKRGIKALVLEKSTVAAAASGRNAGGVRAQCRDRRERALALASIPLWQALEEELGIPVGYRQDGNIRLASTPERMAQLRDEGEEELADGLVVELWDEATLRQRAPYLGDGFVGAKYCPIDGVADPVRATTAFAWAAQELGAIILSSVEAVEILRQGGQITGVVAQSSVGALEIETPIVLHAAGPWSASLAKSIGINIPLRPIRLAIGATAPVTPPFQSFLSSHDLGIAARPTLNGQIYVSGFGDSIPTFSTDVTGQALADFRAIDQMVPVLAGVPFVQAWAGILNVTPDELPILGPVAELAGYFVATGFSGHGFCLGPIVGKLMAEWIVEGEPLMNLDAFRLGRFTKAQLAWQETTASSVIAGQLDR